MKKRIGYLILSVIVVLSLASCGSKYARNDSTSIANNFIESIAGTSSDQKTSADQSSAQPDSEADQVVSNGEDLDQTQKNSNDQNSANTQASADQDNQNAQANQDIIGNSTTSTTIGDHIVLDTKQEEATTAPIVATANSDSLLSKNSENSFQLIQSAGTFKSIDAYLDYLENNGAIYVFSTQEAVNIIKNVCANSEDGVNLCFAGNVDIDSLVNALPQDSTLSGYIDVNDSQCEWKSNSYYFGVKFTWWTTPSEQSSVDSLVTHVLPSLNQGTDYNKIKNVHDYICNNVNYCYDTLAGNANNFSAYDALIGHKAVCQGYALAFQKFMDHMGIPCYIAKGEINVNGTTGPHAWNIVKLNGSWYSVDCTWDGQDDQTRYDYFLLGADEYPYGITGGISLAASGYRN